MSTTTPATFEDVAAVATQLHADAGPFIDPRDVNVTRALFNTLPAWCYAVLGRVPQPGPFGPRINDAEMALLLAAARLGYEPGTPDPDVPVVGP